MKDIQSSAYSRFLNVLGSLDRLSPSEKLDPIQEQMLNFIYLASVNGESLLVGDVILLSQFGAQATVHRRLKSLIGKGYVKLFEEKADGRRKSVHLTDKAAKHYQQLSDCLMQAVKV
jgi:hypothetical protein